MWQGILTGSGTVEASSGLSGSLSDGGTGCATGTWDGVAGVNVGSGGTFVPGRPTLVVNASTSVV